MAVGGGQNPSPNSPRQLLFKQTYGQQASLLQSQFCNAMISRTTAFRALPVIAAGVAAAAYLHSTSRVSAESKKTLLGDDQWVDLKLKKAVDYNHNVKYLYFELPSKDHVLGTEVASAILTKFKPEGGKVVIRPYTPTSPVDTKGEFELVIKKYPGGAMSEHIHSLKEGDTLAFKGPILKYKWEANKHDAIALVGGGTGITPLYQLLERIATDPKDNTKVDLFYGNVTDDDILLKKEIDNLVAKKPDQLRVHYFLDKPSSGWTGRKGYITKEAFSELFGPAAKDKDTHVFVCGPPPLYKAFSGMKVSPKDQGEVTGILSELGYTKDNVFKF